MKLFVLYASIGIMPKTHPQLVNTFKRGTKSLTLASSSCNAKFSHSCNVKWKVADHASSGDESKPSPKTKIQQKLKRACNKVSDNSTDTDTDQLSTCPFWKKKSKKQAKKRANVADESASEEDLQ